MNCPLCETPMSVWDTGTGAIYACCSNWECDAGELQGPWVKGRSENHAAAAHAKDLAAEKIRSVFQSRADVC